MSGVLGDYDQNADDGGILPYNNPRSTQGFGSSLGDRMMNPMVMFGLGLASGKTPQEGIGNAARFGLQGAQYQQQQAARNDTEEALVKLGLPREMARVAKNNPDLLKMLAPELYSKPTWGVIGENPDQTKNYGWIDPRQQTVRGADQTPQSFMPGPPGAN